MLPKNRRIATKQFPEVLKGKRYNTEHLLLYLATNIGSLEKPSKIAFSASKKTFPTAVERNKYRRRGYSAIKKYIKEMHGGYFLLFSFKKGSENINFQTIDSEINQLLSLSGVIS